MVVSRRYILNAILDKKPLFVGIHYPSLQNFNSSEIVKSIKKDYNVSYGNILKTTEKCENLIFVRKLHDKDVINQGSYNVNTSLNVTKVQSPLYKNSTLVAYSMYKQKSSKYYKDSNDLEHSLRNIAEPVITFVSFQNRKMDVQKPEFMNINSFFIKNLNLEQLIAHEEIVTENYLFINKRLKAEYCVAGLNCQIIPGNIYIKIVNCKVQEKNKIL